jgi:hypothetical protein
MLKSGLVEPLVKLLVQKSLLREILGLPKHIGPIPLLASQTSPLQGLVLLQHFNNVFKVKC